MAQPDAAPAAGSSRNLRLRVASALVLAPLAIVAAYMGGWLFFAFWALAAAGILWEWVRLVEKAQNRPVWIVAGILYAGAAVVAPVLLRLDSRDGLLAIILLFAIVWGTDILGYFAGRAIGGPKLAPSISPKKTWSGALAGAAFAVVAAALIAKFAGRSPAFVGCVALLLSIISQAGDLFESWIKRRFDAKDSSGLIPGHGGLMDRLDGFVAAASAAALIGVLRGGFDASARGLVGW